jgi:hypothetical protein
MVEIVQYFYAIVHYETDLHSDLVPSLHFPGWGAGTEKGIYGKCGSNSRPGIAG